MEEGALDEPEIKRLVKQMAGASLEPLSSDQIKKGMDELNDIKVSAGIWQLWTEGKIVAVYDPDEGLAFRAIEP